MLDWRETPPAFGWKTFRYRHSRYVWGSYKITQAHMKIFPLYVFLPCSLSFLRRFRHIRFSCLGDRKIRLHITLAFKECFSFSPFFSVRFFVIELAGFFINWDALFLGAQLNIFCQLSASSRTITHSAGSAYNLLFDINTLYLYCFR